MSTNTFESGNKVSQPAVEITHQWSIENYTYLRYLEKKRSMAPAEEHSIVPSFLQSDPFSPFEVEASCTFYLRLHPNVLQSEGRHMALYLHYDSSEMYRQIEVTCTFSIYNMEYKECNVKDLTGTLTGESDLLGYSEYITIDDLFDPDNAYFPDGKLIINCKLKIDHLVLSTNKLKETLSSKTESSAKVSISGQLSHQWNISRFSSFASSNAHLLTSEDFTCADLTEWTVFLRLWPNGRSTVNANYLSLYLYILAPVETDLKVQYQMSIIDLENVKCNYTKKNQSQLQPFQNEFGYGKFVSGKFVKQKVNSLLVDDNLRLACKVVLFKDILLLQVDASTKNQANNKNITDLTHATITSSIIHIGSTSTARDITLTMTNV